MFLCSEGCCGVVLRRVCPRPVVVIIAVFLSVCHCRLVVLSWSCVDMSSSCVVGQSKRKKDKGTNGVKVAESGAFKG